MATLLAYMVRLALLTKLNKVNSESSSGSQRMLTCNSEELHFLSENCIHCDNTLQLCLYMRLYFICHYLCNHSFQQNSSTVVDIFVKLWKLLCICYVLSSHITML